MKRTILFIVALAIILLAIPTVQAATGNNPSLSGVQMFPADNIWNTPIDDMPVDSHSATWIATLRARSSVLDYNVRFPYNVVDASVAHQYIQEFEFPGESDDVGYPIPASPKIESEWAPGESDYHMLIVDLGSHELYELNYVHTVPGGWYSGAGAVWDYTTNNLRPAGWTSTDAAGLPVLAGLIRYDEVTAGSINHALRLTIYDSDSSYVWPARHMSGVSSNGQRPGMGQYFRLKSSYDISGFSPQSKVILQALKTYGMIVADNGAYNCLSMEPNAGWNMGDLEEIFEVDMNNYEAVDVRSLMVDKDSGQARITSGSISTPTPTPSITVTSPNGGESWKRGTTHTITWSYSGSPGSTVKIVLLKGGTEVSTIVSSVSTGSGGTGSYIWPISSSATTGSNFKVSIQSTSQPTIKDTSNTSFAITSGTPPPSITVTSPNGGESWKRGTTHTITWDYAGTPGSTVKIELLKGDALYKVLTPGTSIGRANHGSYSWKLSATTALGTNYKIRVTSISNSVNRDTSNANFIIN